VKSRRRTRAVLTSCFEVQVNFISFNFLLPNQKGGGHETIKSLHPKRHSNQRIDFTWSHVKLSTAGSKCAVRKGDESYG
jgi:hypothetical protein